MLKKTSFYVITLIIGLILIGISFIFNGDDVKTIAGLCIGIGAGLFGMSVANIFMIRYEKKNPEVMKHNEIEFKDERNTIIRYRAKAMAGDIVQWFIMGIAFVLILINAPLWTIIFSVAVFLLYNVLGMYFISKFQKEM